MNYQFADYAPPVQRLIHSAPTPALGPGSPNHQTESDLRGLTFNELGEQPVVDREMAQCCVSGLWLLHNFLDESHTISQDIATREGSYWHGIMHRREPDYSNAKYWYRQVGEHVIFDSLADAARSAAAEIDTDIESLNLVGAEGDWDPYAFVDLCAQANDSNVDLAAHIAMAEWRLLFDYCFRSAHGE